MNIVLSHCLILFFLDYIMAKTHLSDGARGEMVTTTDIVIGIIGILYVLFNASIVLYLALKFQSNEDRAELLITSTTRVVPELNDGSTPSTDEQTNREKSISMTNQERRRLFLALSNLESRRITAIPEGRREHDHSDEDEEDDEDEDIERNMFDQHVNDEYYKSNQTNFLRHLVRDKRNLGDSKTRLYDLSNGVMEIAIYESIGLSSLLEEDEPPDISLPPETDFEYNNSPLGEFQSSLLRK